MCWTCVDTHPTSVEKIYGKRASNVLQTPFIFVMITD